MPDTQEGEHSPVDDARATLYVYHKYRKDWERAISTGSLRHTQAKSIAMRKAVGTIMHECMTLPDMHGICQTCMAPAHTGQEHRHAQGGGYHHA